MSPWNRTISGWRLVFFQACSGYHIAKPANRFDQKIGDKNIVRSIVAVFMFLSPIFLSECVLVVPTLSFFEHGTVELCFGPSVHNFCRNA